ncbi:MAG: amino acid permease [Microbacterium sp.]|uniref:APC family permease n=1 Tax=Microbacterium sp. TaxID=51671 RepID=UPI001AC5E9CE|nr:amino acid permease [Microbacterium sp.]MBN9177294.1 amino acid permease [Microbacterium sp.]
MPDLSIPPVRAVEDAARPQLTRTLGGFQVFAISFAFISVAVGVFATYGEMLQTAGPVGIWLWVAAAVGQTLVALVVAQFAARIALSGSSYQWASRLATPRVGWFFGWLSFWYLAIAVVTMANAMASQAVMPMLGMEASEETARVLTLGILCVQAVLVILSTRLFALITSAAVAVELGIIAVLVVVLLIVMSVTGSAEPSNVVSRGVAATDPHYLAIGGGLMAGALMGLTTLVGFDSAANLAEEAKNPFRNVPRAIVWSVVAASVAGLAFLVVLTLAIPDIATITADPSPVAAIIRSQLGPVWERMLLGGIVFAFFGAGLVIMAAGARQAFAMARDGRFPLGVLMSRVNRRTRTPVFATVVIVVIGVILMLALPGEALNQLIVAGTLLPALMYGAIVALYLAVRRRMERREGGFSLGRWERPIAVLALIWVLLVLVVLLTPADAFIPGLIVLGLILAGGAYFIWLSLARPAVLDREPGGGDAVEADSSTS